MQLFITCIPGLEPLLANEVKQIVNIEAKTRSGGVSLNVDTFAEVMKLNLYLRTASRVLLHLFDAPCRSADDLYDAFRKRSQNRFWVSYFPNLESFMIDAPLVHHRSFTNSLYAAQLAKDGLCDHLKDALGERPSVDTRSPQVRLVVIVIDNVISAYFDTSLEPLHKRGVRSMGHEAPLRESLAAAVLLTLGLKPDDIICDPCCGSGTLLLEAALIQSNTPPGLYRHRYGFMRHSRFDARLWAKIQEDAKQAIKPLPDGSFLAVDIEAESLALLKEAVHKLGLDNAFIIQQGDFKEVELPKAPTLIVTNPPYGVRLQGDEDLKPLYRSLGDFMKQKSARPARGAVFTTFDMSKEVGLKASKRHVFVNGALDCRLLEYDLFG